MGLFGGLADASILPILPTPAWVAIGAGVAFGAIFLFNLARAPYKQRNDARERVETLEKERIPYLELKPVSGNPHNEYENAPTAWAELQVRNTSHIKPLTNVRVQITRCVYALEKQEQRGSYFLHDNRGWLPTNVYWSERNTQPNTLHTTINPGDTGIALIAHHPKGSVSLGIFNTRARSTFVGGQLIKVFVSSTESAPIIGEYYIEYHPPARDEYEFLEWDEWLTTHKLIGPSNLDMLDSQTESTS